MSSEANPKVDTDNLPTGEFSATKPASEPLTTHGHQPGFKTDNIPTHELEVHPPGTAPKESTFYPQNDPEVPQGGPLDTSDGKDTKA